LEAGDLPGSAYDRRELGSLGGCTEHLDRSAIVEARVGPVQPGARGLAVVGVDQDPHDLVALAESSLCRGMGLWATRSRVPPDLLGVDEPGQRGGDALTNGVLQVRGDVADRARERLVIKAPRCLSGQGRNRRIVGLSRRAADTTGLPPQNTP
jgi:hypothetical protein